jgi:hypothetical protein
MSGVVVVVARCAGGRAALVGFAVSSGYAFHNGSALGRERSAATAEPAQATHSAATSAGATRCQAKGGREADMTRAVRGHSDLSPLNPH